MRFPVAAFFVILALPGVAAAQIAAPAALQFADTPSAATPATPAPPDAIAVKIICLNNQMETGSRITTRVCHTEHQWALLRATGAMAFENMRTRLNNRGPG